MHLIGIIPARGGSKGIPKKNIIPCAGKPLLAYTAAAALAARGLSRVILSTDDRDIVRLGETLGLDIPYLRPPELADDDTPIVDVLQNIMDWMGEYNEPCDGVVLLQPTSPLRRAEHIDSAIALYESHIPTTVVSVTAVPHQFTPSSLMCQTDEGLRPWVKGEHVLRRQDKPTLWARNGPAVLITHPETIRSGTLYSDRVLGYEMDARSSLDVDSLEDLARVEWELTINNTLQDE